MAKPIEQDKAKAGEVLREYGKTHFIVCSESLRIGRMKWSIVPIGQKGQNELNFYLPAEKMLALCLDIKNGIAQKKIAADNGSYPSAYKYVTGENGSRVLCIGGGKVGCRVNIQNKAASQSYTIAIALTALEEMAERFLIWTGYMPVTAGSYFGKQVEEFNAGMNERASYRMNVSDDELATPTNVEEEPEVATPAPEVKPDPPKPAPKTAAPTDSEIGEYQMVVCGEKKPIKDSSGAPCWVFDAKYNGDAVKLLFTEQKANELAWFADFEKNAKKSSNFEAIIKAERRGKFFKVIE